MSKYPRMMAIPFRGSSDVPSLRPKISTNPGPAKVIIDLLMKPISTTITMMAGLLIAKLLQILPPRSNRLSSRIVKQTPLLSPRQPQRKAPAIDTTEQTMLEQLRKWSSPMMGMQIILKFIIKQISQSPVSTEIAIMIRNRSSLSACLQVKVGQLVVVSYQCFALALTERSSQSTCCYYFYSLKSSASCLRWSNKLPTTAKAPVTANPIMVVFLTLAVTAGLKKSMSSLLYTVSSLLGLIMFINRKFQTMPPIPKAITRIAVDLFLEPGNCVQMQLSTGTEIMAYIEPGMMIANIEKVQILKTTMIAMGLMQNKKQQVRTTSQKPNLQHSLLATSMASTMNGTDSNRISEFVCLVILAPWQWNSDRQQRLMFPQQVITAVLNFSSTPPANDLNAEYSMPIFSESIFIINKYHNAASNCPHHQSSISYQSGNTLATVDLFTRFCSFSNLIYFKQSFSYCPSVNDSFNSSVSSRNPVNDFQPLFLITASVCSSCTAKSLDEFPTLFPSDF